MNSTTDNLEEYYAEGLTLLSEYIAIKTVNPPGNELPGLIFLQDVLGKHAVESEIHTTAPGRGVLTARLPGSDPSLKPVVLMNHVDVVPANEEGWEEPPFSGAVRDGYVWGRGALDMKGMAVMELMAMAAAREAGVPLRRGVFFLAVSDEELDGEFGARYVMENLLDDINPALVIDEGGCGMTGMMIKEPVFFIEVTQKNCMKVKVTATGESGHGNAPVEDSAVQRLMTALGKVTAKKRPVMINDTVSETLRRIGGRMTFPRSVITRNIGNTLVKALLGKMSSREKSFNALVRNTISVTMISTGEAPNVIPERAEAVLDVRLIPEQTPDRFMEDLAREAGTAGITFSVISEPHPAPPTSWEVPAFAVLESIIQEELPGVLVTPHMAIGASDSRFFRQQGIPCYGFMPVVIDAEELATYHGRNERLSIENLNRGIRVFYRALERLCSMDTLF